MRIVCRCRSRICSSRCWEKISAGGEQLSSISTLIISSSRIIELLSISCRTLFLTALFLELNITLGTAVSSVFPIMQNEIRIGGLPTFSIGRHRSIYNWIGGPIFSSKSLRAGPTAVQQVYFLGSSLNCIFSPTEALGFGNLGREGWNQPIVTFDCPGESCGLEGGK